MTRGIFMKINSKRFKLLIIYSLLLLTVVVFFPIGKTAADISSPVMDISVSPHSYLFDLSNLKPGDWAERTLTIQNKGKQDFSYLATSKLKEGSERFYNELVLKISDSNKVLFDGKMKDFHKLDPRLIGKNDSEQLVFKVVVPEELGNEFQGLGSEVEFKFYVEGTVGGLLPVDGPKLPNTGSGMFNILITGVILVLIGTIIQLVLVFRRKIAQQV
jgi:hypothetical protein